MLTMKNLSILTVLALGAATPGLASADHDDDRRGYRSNTSWTEIGDVGTHRHDAEDYVSVNTGMRLDRIQLVARDGAVAIDGVTVQFADGRKEFTPVNRRLRAGEAVTVDLPGRGAQIKMLVLDYGNTGPFWRARETAHLKVLGQMADRGDRVRRDRVRAPVQQRPYGGADRDGYDRNGIEWRAGVRVQIR